MSTAVSVSMQAFIKTRKETLTTRTLNMQLQESFEIATIFNYL